MVKIQLFCLLALAISFVSANEENDNWPCYLKKCKRNSENFNDCLIYHANIGFKHIIKGDCNTGIPNFVPLPLEDVIYGENQTFKIYLDEAKVYGINYLNVYKMSWDLDKKEIGLELHHPNTIRISGVYSARGVFDGKNEDANNGKMDLVFGDGVLTYKMNYTTALYNGMNYATIDKCEATRTNEYVRFRFEHTTVDGQKINELSNDRATKLDKALDPELRKLTCDVINKAFRPLFYNFPIDLMFD